MGNCITRYIFPSIFILTAAAGVYPQVNQLPIPPLVYKEKIRKGDYLGALLALKSRESDYRKAGPLLGAYLQTMAPLESQVGNYREAYKYMDEFRSTYWKPRPDVD